MSVTPHKRAALAGKFARLTKAARRAEEDMLVAIFEAHEDGAPYALIAQLIGDRSASGIPAKAAKGKAIAERRRRTGL